MPFRSSSVTHLAHTSPLSATTTNITTSSANESYLSPTSEPALLVPTDRTLEELESQAGSSKSSGVSWLARLGRLSIDREVVLSGYTLYALRTWYLSRDHWSQTIVTPTGKQTEQISVYRLVADPSLSTSEAEAEIARATERLAAENKATVRDTKWGNLLVTTPGVFGQDAFAVPGGDMREARPYLVINTGTTARLEAMSQADISGLRRLGCGGRAAMTLEVPIPALKRKFLEVYRLPAPPAHTNSLSRTNSPQSSPSKSPNKEASPHTPRTPVSPMILTDPLCLMVLEIVRLIQGSLALWGLFDAHQMDGLFCDDTKKGIGVWRRNMGMDNEESLKIEKETSGGCIDPKSLTVLLSSITSTYYQLAVLGQERLPRDPFSRIPRFLGVWRVYHMSGSHPNPSADYLTVSTLASIASDLHGLRARSTDPLQAPRRFLSGVASATSTISANLKGGHIDDTPLRKREYHLSQSQLLGSRANGHGGTSNGLGLILPDEEVGTVASPNAITSNLEAYIAGILKTREKDRDFIGARRIGALWTGHLAGTDWADAGKRRLRDVVRRRTRSLSRDALDEGAESSPPSGAGGRAGPLLHGMRKTGSVLIGGLGLNSRKTTFDETSESEGGLVHHSLRNVLRHNKVPMVVEPDVEEVDEQLRGRGSLSPSPTNLDRPNGWMPALTHHLSANSMQSLLAAKRPSIQTNPSAGSNLSISLPFLSRVGDRERRSTAGDLRQLADQLERENGIQRTRELSSRTDHSQRTVMPSGVNELTARAPGAESKNLKNARVFEWMESMHERAMRRTASDGADMELRDDLLEWEVVNPHGTGKGHHGIEDVKKQQMTRRHSLQPLQSYEGLEPISKNHLVIDMELAYAIQQLRGKERELAAKSAELEGIERSIRQATLTMQKHLSTRNHNLQQLKQDAEALAKHLQSLPDGVDEDETIRDLTNKIAYHTTGDTNSQELRWRLVDLMEEWDVARAGNEARRREATRVDKNQTRSWWGS